MQHISFIPRVVKLEKVFFDLLVLNLFAEFSFFFFLNVAHVFVTVVKIFPLFACVLSCSV